MTQQTLQGCSVRKYDGKLKCEKPLGIEAGEIKHCSHTAEIVIINHSAGTLSRYCTQHSKPTWLDMAGVKK